MSEPPAFQLDIDSLDDKLEIPRTRAIGPVASDPGSEFASIAALNTLASIAMRRGRPMKAAASDTSSRYECASAREERTRAFSPPNEGS